MDLPIKIVIGGLGVRGYEVYASYAKRNPDKMQVTAIAEPNPIRRRDVQRDLGLSDSQCYETMESLLQQPRLGDVAVIATQDRDHVRLALPALEKGITCCSKSPSLPFAGMSGTAASGAPLRPDRHRGPCAALHSDFLHCETAAGIRRDRPAHPHGSDRKCGLLAFCPQLCAGQLAPRGGFQPHDSGKKLPRPGPAALVCRQRLYIPLLQRRPVCFRAESAPEGADDRCTRCALSTRCPYSAVRIYMENEKTGILGGNAGWPCSVLSETPTPDSIRAALEKGPYGRCVYACDNDVADHQCVNMQFANGVCATFTVTAFTQECCRTMRAMGSLGELEIDMLRNRVMLRRFGQPEQIIELDKLTDRFAGHGGGDDRMMDALAALFQREDPASLTSVDVSIDSHIMALAAERSRLEGGACIDLLQFARRT